MSSETINNIMYSDEKKLLDVDVIHKFLSEESYWSKGIPKEIVKASIEGSRCFAAYKDGRQIAFARLITDSATFGYLADVFVIHEERGNDIGKSLMSFVLRQPEIKRMRKIMLATRDKHIFYQGFGFRPLSGAERYMELPGISEYKSE